MRDTVNPGVFLPYLHEIEKATALMIIYLLNSDSMKRGASFGDQFPNIQAISHSPRQQNSTNLQCIHFFGPLRRLTSIHSCNMEQFGRG